MLKQLGSTVTADGQQSVDIWIGPLNKVIIPFPGGLPHMGMANCSGPAIFAGICGALYPRAQQLGRSFWHDFFPSLPVYENRKLGQSVISGSRRDIGSFIWAQHKIVH